MSAARQKTSPHSLTDETPPLPNPPPLPPALPKSGELEYQPTRTYSRTGDKRQLITDTRQRLTHTPTCSLPLRRQKNFLNEKKILFIQTPQRSFVSRIQSEQVKMKLCDARRFTNAPSHLISKNAPKFAYGNGRFIERFPFKEQPHKRIFRYFCHNSQKESGRKKFASH